MRYLRIWDDANSEFKADIRSNSIIISAVGLRFEYYDEDKKVFSLDDEPISKIESKDK